MRELGARIHYVNQPFMNDMPANDEAPLLPPWASDLNLDGEVTLADHVLWLKQALLLPGDWVLSATARFAPNLIAQLGLAGTETGGAASLLVSIAVYLVTLLLVLHITRSLLRKLAYWIDSLRIAATVRLRSIARRWQALREWRPFGMPSRGLAVEADVVISEADLAVLRTQSKLQPGYVLTAPEIANIIRLRPSQVEAILEKLRALQLVEFAFGSLDGYDGYRITSTGRMYLKACGESVALA